VQAKEFVRQHCGEVPPKEGWVTAPWFVAHTVVEEMVYGPVCEATQAGLGFRGEIQLMTFGVIRSEGVLDCKLHCCARGVSSDGDVLLCGFFRGDGHQEKGVVTAIGWLGNGIVVSGTVAEE